MGATWPSGLDQVAVKLPSPAGAAVRAPGAPGGVLSTFSVIGSAVARLPAASLTTAWSRCGPSPTAAVLSAWALGVMCAQGMGRELSQAPLSMVCWWPSTNQPASAVPVPAVRTPQRAAGTTGERGGAGIVERNVGGVQRHPHVVQPGAHDAPAGAGPAADSVVDGGSVPEREGGFAGALARVSAAGDAAGVEDRAVGAPIGQP